MKATSIKTVGILTSGGDAPGLNAAIRALCISGKNNYGMKFIGIKNGYRGLIDNDVVKMDDFDLENMISLGGTILGTSRVKPFKNPVPDIAAIAVKSASKGCFPAKSVVNER